MDKGKKAAVFVSNPKDIYSGGRYYALMLAEALAELGIETYYVTNVLPIFWKDMEVFPSHSRIKVVYGFEQAIHELPEHIDVSFIVPGTSDPKFYEQSIDCSMSRKAKISLINFESANWFNSYVEEKKDEAFWSEWKKIASASSLVLSISEEGSKFAKDFYHSVPKTSLFEYCYPPINSHIADNVLQPKRTDRVLLFARFQRASHKGGERVVEILNESFSGWKLTVVVGTGVVPDSIKKSFENRAKKFNIELEWLFKISDEDKFTLYKSSKVLLFPSYFEGFGYPPIEARYCGCKVVAFELPVLKETCGNDIVFAKHGDWNDFGDKVSSLLKSNEFTVTGEGLKEVAPFSAMVESLDKILDKLNTIPNNYNNYIVQYKSNNRIGLINNVVIKAESVLAFFIKKLREKYLVNKREITYFPKFNESSSLTSHYYRAAWYLPFYKGGINNVSLYTNNDSALEKCPEFMGQPSKKDNHIRLRKGKWSYLLSLLKSDVILLWQGDCQSWWLKILKLSEVTIVNVDTHDPTSREYGAYPAVIWRNLLTNEQRKDVIDDSYKKFTHVAQQLKLSGINKAAVFGTAPSLESALEYDFSDCVNIICNSTVQNKRLLEHIKPTFVTAGDAVSHFGVSVYAYEFRKDLCEAIIEHNLYLFCTAEFGFLLAQHYPELKDKFIFIEQKNDGPNFNLLESFSAPRLDSTMNIHMLPLAATFAKDIFVLGCDGKDPDEEKNEDFWGHASSAQYHSLVDSGHQCHPTFDLHRKISTYSGYVSSVLNTLNLGTYGHGIRYTSLKKSYVPGFKDRHLTDDWYIKHNLLDKISLNKISQLLPKVDIVDSDYCCDKNLETKLNVSGCFLSNTELLIKGWFLTPFRAVELKVTICDNTHYIFRRIKRPDLLAKFPEYMQENVGFEFKSTFDDSMAPQQVKVELVYGKELLLLKKIKVER